MKVLTAEQMQQVDRLSTELYHIPSLLLMENAATQIHLISHSLAPSNLSFVNPPTNGNDVIVS